MQAYHLQVLIRRSRLFLSSSLPPSLLLHSSCYTSLAALDVQVKFVPSVNPTCKDIHTHTCECTQPQRGPFMNTNIHVHTNDPQLLYVNMKSVYTCTCMLIHSRIHMLEPPTFEKNQQGSH